MSKLKRKRTLSIYIEHTAIKVAMLNMHYIQPEVSRKLSERLLKAYQLRERL